MDQKISIEFYFKNEENAFEMLIVAFGESTISKTLVNHVYISYFHLSTTELTGGKRFSGNR